MGLLCKQQLLRRLWPALRVFCSPGSNALSMRSNQSVPWYQEHLETQGGKWSETKPLVKAGGQTSSILKNPGVVCVDNLNKEALCELLAQNVVYREGPLVAINKPQGLSIAGSSDKVSLLSLLPELQQLLAIKAELHVVKAAPIHSSGLVLLSSCHVTTKTLEEFYARCRKSRKPFTTFRAVTVGVPDPAQGEVKEFLTVEQIGDRDQVVPVKQPSKGSLESREVKRTETWYKVLCVAHGCSLLQLQPMTVFQDQLLVHCTLKFCPVLGDHAYSARVAKVLGENIFVPADIALPKTQVVEENILAKMHFPFRELHRMPLHLHLHQLLMPSDPPGQYPSHLTAPPPPFFQRTMELLGLNMGQ